MLYEAPKQHAGKLDSSRIESAGKTVGEINFRAHRPVFSETMAALWIKNNFTGGILENRISREKVQNVF